MLSSSFRPPSGGWYSRKVHTRGRSRQVSPVALARQASEERRLSLLQTPEHAPQPACAIDGVAIPLGACSHPDPPIDLARDGDPEERIRTTRWHDPQRARRLRICQKIWDEQTQRRHSERILAVRRREQSALDELRRHIADKEQASRAHVHDDHRLFQYNFMPPIPRLPPNSIPKLPAGRQRTVSFQQVLSSMDGTLFPLDPAERAEHARRITGITTLYSQRRQSSARSQLLLHTLLHVVDCHQPKQPPPHSNTPPSVPSMSSSISTTRSNSWLSFGSWCSSLSDVTVPESSSTVASSPKSLPLPAVCESRRNRRLSVSVPVSLDETPLCPPKPQSSARQFSARPAVNPAAISSESRLLESMGRSLVRHVGRIVDAAKGLQSAYIAASMFSIYLTPSGSCPQVCSNGSSLQPYGYRARPTDVKKFTTPPVTATTPEAIHFIPLVSPASSAALPSPSSHSLIVPSPLRPRVPPAALAYRMRPVANPEVLRLRALQNLMCARGKEWEGRGREGGRGCGKERMLGIAFEGRGPSGLGCEVRMVVA